MPHRTPHERATSILVNGIVRPEADAAAPHEALAIADGRVRRIGSSADLLRDAEASTRIIDLDGRTVLPAFVDSHTHFHRGATLRHLYLDFAELKPANVADVIAAVEARARSSPADAWIEGDSLSALKLAEGRLPNRQELDAAAPHHPVVLRGVGKHVVAANGQALSIAGISRDTADPSGGRIERDRDGEPTGVLHERAKLRLDTSAIDTVVPKPSRVERLEALRIGIRDLHRHGIATIHEMVRLPEEADDLAALHAAGELGVRVRLYYRVHESPLSLDWLVKLGVKRGLGDDWLRVIGVKISVDGFCIFRNAAVYQGYADDPDNCGLMRIEPDELNRLVAVANQQGLNVAVHAVGVRAVDAALDAFEAAGPAVAGPHRVEHAYLDMDEGRFGRMRQLGLAWSTQPGFIPAYREEWQTIFDPDRRRRLMPLRSGVEQGLPLLLNSDYPCSPIDPLATVRVAVGEQVDQGVIAGDQAIGLSEAWRAASIGSSVVTGDVATGPLRAGNLADLTVLDADPFAHNANLAGISVSATVIQGEFVFDNAGISR